jgi:hypothetical protein
MAEQEHSDHLLKEEREYSRAEIEEERAVAAADLVLLRDRSARTCTARKDGNGAWPFAVEVVSGEGAHLTLRAL